MTKTIKYYISELKTVYFKDIPITIVTAKNDNKEEVTLANFELYRLSIGDELEVTVKNNGKQREVSK